MKIVVASDTYYPMTNGVAVFAHNLALGLARQGHEVLVVCPSFNGRKHRRKDKKTGVTVVYLKSKRFPFYPDQIKKIEEKKRFLGRELPRLFYKNGLWAALNPYSEIKKALDDFRPDVIHLQTAGTIALGIQSYVKKRNIPMVSTGHSYPDNITGQFKFLKPIKKPVDAMVKTYLNSFLKHSEYATMPTEMAIDDLVPKNRRWFKVPIEALSNGVDLSQFSPGKPNGKIVKKYRIDLARPRVLYVGRVDPEKSISVVMEAFHLVLTKMPEVEFLVVGDGTDRVKLERMAKEYGMDGSVRFLGKVMPPDLQQVYKAGTVFATASETETQGIVLIEAAATGLPLVAVDAGAVKELCQNKKNGILCKPRDVEGMARAIVKILSNKELQKKYGEKSLEVAKKHDLNTTLGRFEEIYKIAIDLKQKESR